MKRNIILFSTMLFLSAYAQDYSGYCSKNVPKKTFPGVILSTIGVNSLSRNIAESILQKEIKKETNAKFKVKINNFYSTNFFNGEFKTLNATAKKYQHDGIYLSDIGVKTVCPYNKISFEDNTLYFDENLVLNMSAYLDENDLKKTVKSGKLNKKLGKILSKISTYDSFLPIINSMLPLSFPIKIDKKNNAKMTIEKIEVINMKIKLIAYILILKNS